MLGKSLKASTINGIIWTTFQRGGTLFIGFVGNLFLARLLSPSDYGCIGLILIFTSIADVLIEGGFGSVIIQKKNLDKNDCSTVFVSNIVISLFLFITLFCSAPFIGDFFNNNILKSVLRIESITIILRSLYLVQASLIQKKLDFKKISILVASSQLVSVVFSVFAAYAGFGVWSLVVKDLTLQFMLCVLYWKYSAWNFSLRFNFELFKNMFGFGSKITLSNLLQSAFTNVESFILGHKFSPSTLGFYSQANSLGQVPIYSISMIANAVFFPVFSKITEEQKLIDSFSRSLISITYIAFPVIILLAVLSEHVISLLYTSRWLPSAPFLMIICLTGLINSVVHTNFTLLKSLRKGGVYLKSNFLINGIKLCVIIIGLKWGLWGVLFGHLIGTYIGCGILCYFTGRVIDYGLIKQLKILLPHFLLAVTVGFFMYCFIQLLEWQLFYLILVAGIAYVCVYIFLSFVFRVPGFLIYKEIVVEYFKR